MSDLYSPSTVPLLKYLTRSHAELKDEGKNLFSVIKRTACEVDDKDPIDESFGKYQEFIRLVQDPITTKISGKSVGVSASFFQMTSVLMRLQVTVVGAGVSGLCTAFGLKRCSFTVQVLEASSRVGGRVITFRDPALAPQLHAEGGAM